MNLKEFSTSSWENKRSLTFSLLIYASFICVPETRIIFFFKLMIRTKQLLITFPLCKFNYECEYNWDNEKEKRDKSIDSEETANTECRLPCLAHMHSSYVWPRYLHPWERKQHSLLIHRQRICLECSEGRRLRLCHLAGRIFRRCHGLSRRRLR